MINAKVPFKDGLRVLYTDHAGRLRHRDFSRDATDAEIIAGIASAAIENTKPPAHQKKEATELEVLRAEAKALGIKSPHMMKKETLIAKIKAAKGE